MRLTTPLMIAAAALLAASPAAAQNAATPTDDAVVDTANNTTGVAANDLGATTPVDTAAAPGAETVVLPPDGNTAAVDNAYGEPAQEEHHGFPWGVLGLLGLLGLIPRLRRGS